MKGGGDWMSQKERRKRKGIIKKFKRLKGDGWGDELYLDNVELNHITETYIIGCTKQLMQFNIGPKYSILLFKYDRTAVK